MKTWLYGAFLAALALAILLAAASAGAQRCRVCPPFALCPDHGAKGAYTSNRKVVGNHTYCQYEHPLFEGGVHKFWHPCD